MANEHPPQKNATGFLTLPNLRDLLLLLFIAIAAWKLVNSEFQIDLSEFSFSELLALILSLFSVWLSVAFYFKAGETSSQFYDNSYKFTKEMSEILGRIEAGFGEKLRHIDEGYSGIRERFDRMPQYNNESINADVKKEEAEIKKQQEEQHALLEDLATRAKLAEGEKEEIFAQLAEKAEALEQAHIELRVLRKSKENMSLEESDTRRGLIKYLARKINGNMPENLDTNTRPPSINRIFRTAINDLHSDALSDLSRFEMLTEGGNLTPDATYQIRNEMRKLN